MIPGEGSSSEPSTTPGLGRGLRLIAGGCWAQGTAASQTKHPFLFSQTQISSWFRQETRGQWSPLPLCPPGSSKTTTITPRQQQTLITSRPRGLSTDTNLPLAPLPDTPPSLTLHLCAPPCPGFADLQAALDTHPITVLLVTAPSHIAL